VRSEFEGWGLKFDFDCRSDLYTGSGGSPGQAAAQRVIAAPVRFGQDQRAI
jgi:hypothetical protein